MSEEKKITTSEKEGWNSTGTMTAEHYFIIGVSLCEKYRYKTRLYFHPDMVALEVKAYFDDPNDTTRYCKVCDYKLKQIVRVRNKYVKRKRIIRNV